jgi:hypothetical protein
MDFLEYMSVNKKIIKKDFKNSKFIKQLYKELDGEECIYQFQYPQIIFMILHEAHKKDEVLFNKYNQIFNKDNKYFTYKLDN